MYGSYEEGQTVFRHGDVLLKKTAQKVRRRKGSSRVVLHKGMNHDHVATGSFYVREEHGRRFLGVLGPTTLTHDEHGPIKLTPEALGQTELELDVQVEYDHWLEESRQVID